eukprot:8875285-Karenia_brevis.AAC.1
MFSKACLPQLPGGKAKARRNLNIIRNRLERWQAGERRSLWDDIPVKFGKVGMKKFTEEQKLRRRQETCIAYCQNGMPGKAVDRLIGAELAPDTEDTYVKMKSKFSDPPPGQQNSQRPPAPESNELSEEIVAKAICSFKRGLGAGPSGTRPDFLRQIIGSKGDKPGLTLITQLCNVLADGMAPDALRPFMGGANGFSLSKESKAAKVENAEAGANRLGKCEAPDVRPVCCGEVWRRVVGK